ncbi:MAG: DUF1592 domain-containing protein, partial [Myxococcota bacterium]
MLERRVGSGETATIMASLDTAFATVPADARSEEQDYLQMDMNISQAHNDGYYAVAKGIADRVTQSDLAAQFVGDCAADGDTSNDAECVDDFIRDFGLETMRRPLVDAEIDFFRDEVYRESGPIDFEGVADIITALLLSPEFTFRIENANPPLEGKTDVYPLSAFELASRLAFHFWQTAPDRELLDAAASGRLDTDEGYTAEVDRIFRDPRTEQAIDHFYEQWLDLESMPDMTAFVEQADFQAFAGDDLPDPELRENILQDTRNLLRYYTWLAEDGTLNDLFLSELSFAGSEDVAQLYGPDVPLYRAREPPGLLPAGQRAGLLTRVAMVANNRPGTRPIKKGVFIRRRLMCDPLYLPEEVDAEIVEAQRELENSTEATTTRARVERIT